MSYPTAVERLAERVANVRWWWCGVRTGHDYYCTTPAGVTPLLVCRLCGKTGWLL